MPNAHRVDGSPPRPLRSRPSHKIDPPPSRPATRRHLCIGSTSQAVKRPDRICAYKGSDAEAALLLRWLVQETRRAERPLTKSVLRDASQQEVIQSNRPWDRTNMLCNRLAFLEAPRLAHMHQSATLGTCSQFPRSPATMWLDCPNSSPITRRQKSCMSMNHGDGRMSCRPP